MLSTLETALVVRVDGQTALNVTIPDNPFGYWEEGAYGSGLLLLGLSGVCFLARQILVLLVSFCKPTSFLARVVRYLHKAGKLSLSGLVVSVVLWNSVDGLKLTTSAGLIQNDVVLNTKWGLLFLVAGTAASTLYSHIVSETIKTMRREASAAVIVKVSPNRELALAMVDSAGSFRGLVIFFTAAGVFVWAWLCGTVYIFSYGGVFGPSAPSRRYTPASMIESLDWQQALPFAIFSWVFPALLIIQCAARCFFRLKLAARTSIVRSLLSPSTTALLASLSFTEFLLAAEILVAPEVNLIVNQTLHDQSLTPKQKAWKNYCAVKTHVCLSKTRSTLAASSVSYCMHCFHGCSLP